LPLCLPTEFSREILERAMGFEPATPILARFRSVAIERLHARGDIGCFPEHSPLALARAGVIAARMTGDQDGAVEDADLFGPT
jgi:hypothetical protein